MQQSHEPTAYIRAACFDRLTPVYDLLVAALARERAWRPALLAQVRVEPGMRVLDLGCGTGTLAIAIARVQPGATIVGLDGDATILARARRKAAAASVEIEFVEGLAQDPPLPRASFDAVVSSLLFHHPAAKELALVKAREGREWPRPRGMHKLGSVRRRIAAVR